MRAKRKSTILAGPVEGASEAEPRKEHVSGSNNPDGPMAYGVGEIDELERIEEERDRRFQESEQELVEVLEAEGLSDHVRKRQLTRLFDRFRLEYNQLSVKLRESLQTQRRIMDKCLEMKNELVMTAVKIKTAKQIQEEEIKSLMYYREECEHAWKATKICEERERDAMRIIDDLKSEIEELQTQIKTLLHVPGSTKIAAATVASGAGSNTPHLGSPTKQQADLTPIRSPLKQEQEAQHFTMRTRSPTKFAEAVEEQNSLGTEIMSFDEWKVATRVWSLSTSQFKAPTPSHADFLNFKREQEIIRCVSVPSLQPSAMERASTAISSSPKHRLKVDPDTRRAVTSIGGKRPPTQALPDVALRHHDPRK